MNRQNQRTDECDHLNFLPKLILVSSCNPVTITTIVGDAADPSEHITTDHDENGYDSSGSPGPSVLYNRGNETEEKEGTKDTNGDGDEFSPVNWVFVRDRNGGEFG